MIIDGKRVAAEHRQALAKQVAQAKPALGLGVILATDDAAVLAYVGSKKKAAAEVGYQFALNDLGSNATEAALLAACQEFNQRPDVTGYIVQTPLPQGVDKLRLFAAVDPGKDADGLTPTNLGYLFTRQERILPATPKGILSLLAAYDVPIAGAVVTVVGKGALTGLPIATLLSHRGATVISCDSKTRHLAAQTRQADILVVAVGSPGMITGEMVKPGVVVLDVGITRVGGQLKGDVDFDSVAAKAAAITPVPGGVGPMTVVSLLENVFALSQTTISTS